MTDAKPVLSIVVPAYNAGRTLRRAVESLTAQTLKDLEVWIVDDGSTDDTPRIADRLAAEDSRVHVVHKPNGGCYNARLDGLRRARGAWFGFCDADDFVEPSMYGRMVAVAEREGLDALQIDPVGEDNGRGLELFPSREAVLRGYAFPVLMQGRRASLVWDKIYRNRYDVASFAEFKNTTYEDHALNLQFFGTVDSFGWLHEPLYHYDVNVGSSVKNFKWDNVAGLVSVAALKRQLAPGFLPDGVDGEAVLANWFAKNLLNLLWIASTARNTGFRDAVRNVRRIQELDVLKDMRQAARGRCRMLLCAIPAVPATFVVILFRMAFPLRGILRRGLALRKACRRMS